MGPYSFMPFMECKHGILSLDNSVDGALEVDGLRTEFDGGRGYVEKDWGRSFPAGYVWAQSNHFEETGVCITASVARIPWLTSSFRGFLVGFLRGGVLHRFTTYTGAEIDRLTVGEHRVRLEIHDRHYRLEVDARKTGGAILHAPYENQMLERVAETMTSSIDVRLSTRTGDRTLYEGRGEHGCLEVQGDLEAVLDA